MISSKIRLRHTNIIYFHKVHLLIYTVDCDLQFLRKIFQKYNHILILSMTINLIRKLDVNSNLGDTVIIFYPSDRKIVNRIIGYVEKENNNIFHLLADLIEKRTLAFCKFGIRFGRRAFRCDCIFEEEDITYGKIPSELLMYTDVADEFDLEHLSSIVEKMGICMAYDNIGEMRNVLGAFYFYRREWPLLILVDRQEQKLVWKSLIRKYFFQWECAVHIKMQSVYGNVGETGQFNEYENLIEEIYESFQDNYNLQEFDESVANDTIDWKKIQNLKIFEKTQFRHVNFHKIHKRVRKLCKMVTICTFEEYVDMGCQIFSCIISHTRISNENCPRYDIILSLAMKASHFVQFYNFQIDPIDEEKLLQLLAHIKILTHVGLHRPSYYNSGSIYINNKTDVCEHYKVLHILRGISYGQIICEPNLLTKILFIIDLVNIY